MYIYDRRFPIAPLPMEQSMISRPVQRDFYHPDRTMGSSVSLGGSTVLSWVNDGSGRFSVQDPLQHNLSDDQDKTETRKGTQVLYVRPTPPKPWKKGKITYQWSFDTAEGRGEYETALHKHLKAKKVVSDDVVYEPLASSTDIAKLGSKRFANLLLIVHSAANGPAIGVDLGSSAAGTKADWIKDDKFADAIAPLGYTNITILGCDSVSNKFTPNLAKRLPKGARVIGHKGGDFVINRHFEPEKKVPGRLRLTRVSSNLRLKAFES